MVWHVKVNENRDLYRGKGGNYRDATHLENFKIVWKDYNLYTFTSNDDVVT